MSTKISPESNVLSRAQDLRDKLINIRRQIHTNPELSFQEHATGRLIAEVLSPLGYKVQSEVGGTGVVAEIGQGRTVIIRADMDALPIQETNGPVVMMCM
jgi:hippurate hydrolase